MARWKFSLSRSLKDLVMKKTTLLNIQSRTLKVQNNSVLNIQSEALNLQNFVLNIESFIFEVPNSFISYIKKYQIFVEKEKYDNCTLYEYTDRKFPKRQYRHIKKDNKYFSENILIYQHQ